MGIQLRKWTSPRSALTFGWGAASEFRYHSTESTYTLETDLGPRTVSTSPKLSPPDTWRTTLSAGFAHTLADTVTLQLAVSFQYNVLQDGSLAPLAIESRRAQLALNVGSVQSIGLRPQHLVQVHLSDHVALNFDAALNYRLADRAVHESYLLGASFLW
jgi:hypothetical protein